MEDLLEIGPRVSGQRRRFTAEQKKRLLDLTMEPGRSVTEVARIYGIAPSQMFTWRRAMEDGGNEGLKANERVVPESELKKAQNRIKELERALGRKTMDVEILREAVRIAREKKWISPKKFPGEEDIQ